MSLYLQTKMFGFLQAKMYWLFLWVIYIYILEILEQVWHRKLCINTWYSSKWLQILSIFLVWLLGPKCYNAPTLYATEDEQKLLGVIIDRDLHFKSHAKSIIKTTNQKLSAFIEVTPFMTDVNKKVIFKFFIKGQFNYCSFL